MCVAAAERHVLGVKGMLPVEEARKENGLVPSFYYLASPQFRICFKCSFPDGDPECATRAFLIRIFILFCLFVLFSQTFLSDVSIIAVFEVGSKYKMDFFEHILCTTIFPRPKHQLPCLIQKNGLDIHQIHILATHPLEYPS